MKAIHDEDLLGYALHALQPEEARRIEAYLALHPEAQARVDELCAMLRPLAWDTAAPAAPPDLTPRTLAFVAAHCCRDLPPAPPVKSGSWGGDARPWWRRAEVLVAACLILTVLGAGVPYVQRARQQQAMLTCKNNLHTAYTALQTYQTQHRRMPNIAHMPPPQNVAGMVLPILAEQGHLPRNYLLLCPGHDKPIGTVPFGELSRMSPEEFQRQAAHLMPSYSYTLGYIGTDGRIYGAEPLPGQTLYVFPLMADSPPSNVADGNSPNHGGKGQNVLYADGHVEFRTDRHAGFDKDDIYLNKLKFVGAGVDPKDAVLGHSASKP